MKIVAALLLSFAAAGQSAPPTAAPEMSWGDGQAQVRRWLPPSDAPEWTVTGACDRTPPDAAALPTDQAGTEPTLRHGLLLQRLPHNAGDLAMDGMVRRGRWTREQRDAFQEALQRRDNYTDLEAESLLLLLRIARDALTVQDAGKPVAERCAAVSAMRDGMRRILDYTLRRIAILNQALTKAGALEG